MFHASPDRDSICEGAPSIQSLGRVFKHTQTASPDFVPRSWSFQSHSIRRPAMKHSWKLPRESMQTYADWKIAWSFGVLPDHIVSPKRRLQSPTFRWRTIRHGPCGCAVVLWLCHAMPNFTNLTVVSYCFMQFSCCFKCCFALFQTFDAANCDELCIPCEALLGATSHAPVRDVVWSPDGELLLAASVSGSRVWRWNSQRWCRFLMFLAHWSWKLFDHVSLTFPRVGRVGLCWLVFWSSLVQQSNTDMSFICGDDLGWLAMPAAFMLKQLKQTTRARLSRRSPSMSQIPPTKPGDGGPVKLGGSPVGQDSCVFFQHMTYNNHDANTDLYNLYLYIDCR